MTKLVLLLLSCVTFAMTQTTDWQPIEGTFHKHGEVEGEVLKFSFPRTDLKVNIGNIPIDPRLALTSWIAFKSSGEQMVMMGDLVLLQSEVVPVMWNLVPQRIQITALHNHLLGESPTVVCMHIEGTGNAAQLAKTMIAVLGSTGTPIMASLGTDQSVKYDWSKIESILGWTGVNKGSVLQFTIPRLETIIQDTMYIPPSMGMTSRINFQIVGGKAALAGELVLVAKEVNPVIKALTDNGISVTAVHNHMLSEFPRMFFLHFWAIDNPEPLARGVKAAIDLTNAIKPIKPK